MTPNRPYLLRAIYDWIVDNRLTPYVVVNADYPHVEVPRKYVENGRIILNISPQAIQNLSMGNYIVEFEANFSGHIQHIYLPLFSINAIYAYENGRGMIFQDEDGNDDGGGDHGDDEPQLSASRTKGPPQLRVVK